MGTHPIEPTSPVKRFTPGILSARRLGHDHTFTSSGRIPTDLFVRPAGEDALPSLDSEDHEVVGLTGPGGTGRNLLEKDALSLPPDFLDPVYNRVAHPLLIFLAGENVTHLRPQKHFHLVR